MTPLLIERELTREKAREAIIQTLERFAGLFDKLSRDSRFIVFDERFTRIHWRIENELFIARASQFFNGDEYQRLGNEGIREFLLKLKGLSEKFCLKVVIPQDVEIIETEIENLDYSEKIRRAIEYSNVIDEIIEEIGDINTLVAQMVIVSGILIGLATTGYGAAAEALGFVILAAGAAISGTQLLAGIIELAEFFTTVDDAKTEDDLKKCGKIFGDAVAKIGVDGLFFFLSMFGLKKASARLTTRTVIDNGLNSRKWAGKQIEERELSINQKPPVKRIEKQIEIKFEIKEKFDVGEYNRQLKNQEDGLNKLTIQEYLDNIKEYKSNGRGTEAAKVQRQVRNVEKAKKISELRRKGHSSEEAEKLAEEWIKTQAALHNPDMSAGGNPLDVTGVGDAKINSSIGSQWGNGNAELLETQIQDLIKAIEPEEYTTTYLNVKLVTE